MDSDQVESIFLNDAGGDIREYLLIGGGLFLVIAVLGFGEQAMWPKRTGFEMVDIGTVSIQLSTLTGIFHIGLLGLGIFLAFMPARRNNGLLLSLLLGSVPVLGFGIGVFFYYAFFEKGTPLIPPSYLLVGAIVGTIGFILGRMWG